MTILVISDIHGSLTQLNKSLEVYHKENADLILILGDELYHGPRNPLPLDYNPKEVAIILNNYRDKIIAVRGNCDSEVDQMVLEFPITSDISTLFWKNKKIVASHGHIYNYDNLPSISKGEIFIQGHTHIPVAEYKDDTYLLNPGSISLPKGGFEPSYGLFKDNSFQVKTFDNEVLKEIKFNKQ